jgi:hypothetical protein
MLGCEHRLVGDGHPRGFGQRVERTQPQVIDDLLGQVGQGIEFRRFVRIDSLLDTDVDRAWESPLGHAPAM